MRPSRPRCRCPWLAVVLLAAAGCAASGPAGTGQDPRTGAWQVNEAAQSALELEHQRLVAMLRQLSATGDAYDRMSEARATIMDAVSWWGAFRVEQQPPAAASAEADGTESCTPDETPAPSLTLDDPYAEADEAPTAACPAPADLP